MRDRAAERRDFLARAQPGACVPVARVFPSDRLTPVMLFSPHARRGLASASCSRASRAARRWRGTPFSGRDPVARWTVEQGQARLERGGVVEPCAGAPLEALERLVRRERFVPDPDLPPLAAGAVGYLCYDAVRLFEAIPDRHPRVGAIPDAQFLLYDAVAAFDHPRQRLLLLTTLDLTGRADPGARWTAAIARLDRLQAFLERPDPARARRDAPTRSAFVPAMPRRAYLDAVGAVKEAIAAGDVYQCVLSQRWTGRAGIDPFDVYRALRALNPSPYLYYLETREASVLGSSPEMLVRCRGREVETRPIAGTAARGATPEEDARLAGCCSADPKERAEHVMLVDLARNDLGRVCEIGSVRVAALRVGREVLARAAPRLRGPRAARGRAQRRGRAGRVLPGGHAHRARRRSAPWS